MSLTFTYLVGAALVIACFTGAQVSSFKVLALGFICVTGVPITVGAFVLV